MENLYRPEIIEPKWQAFWQKEQVFSTQFKEKKFYVLDMFPYPSGDGLHVGHVENFTATDILARYKHLTGHAVMHPMGWDAFGLPAENFAIKTGIHPSQKTEESIANFKRQMQSLGLNYNWDREINTSSPEYYQWTQWMFLFFYKNGLAYKKKAKVNWCSKDQTVLANEQVVNGLCDRCGTEVIQKDLEQWFFKITDFIEDQTTEKGGTTRGLLTGLETLDWPSSTLAAQKHWIGRSEGTEVSFTVAKTENIIRIFTTRVDTLFGCAYVVIAPEHPLLQEEAKILNKESVQNYIQESKKKTDLERTELNKEKTGILLEGIEVLHPITGKSLPVYVADYVLATYGTGAVMGVPAHDERDFEFANKYGIDFSPVIEECVVTEGKRDDAYKPEEKTEARNNVAVCVYNPKDETFLTISWKHFDMRGVPTGGIEEGESIESTARREILEETGYKNIQLVGIPAVRKHTKFFHRGKKVNRHALWNFALFVLVDEERVPVSQEDEAQHEVVWAPKKDIQNYFTVAEAKWAVELFENKGKESASVEDGILINSEAFTGLSSGEAREEITGWLEKEGRGNKKVQYRLRDWLLSRQRYWGAPIPIIYCDDCGAVPVPETDLPVLLPTDVDFRPTGESPLVRSEAFHNITCPTCKKKARRESDTMDTFVCSSWYYLRFADPKNTKEFASKEALESLLPVDFYMGGAEHTVLHLLYARFFTKVLHKYGLVHFDEPFTTLRHQGMIMAEDGRKMSKSLGNVVNPDEMVHEFGADSLRLYEMFMGPLDEMKAWKTQNIVGPRRFLEKVWKLSLKVGTEKSSQQESLIQKTVQKITLDIEAQKYNTVVSGLMMLANQLEKESVIDAAVFERFLILLSPLAPHIAEELWEKQGHTTSIFAASWPVFDEKKVLLDKVTLVVQINGKVRDQFEIEANSSEEEVKKIALGQEKVKEYTKDKEIRKVIIVPNKLVSIVIS